MTRHALWYKAKTKRSAGADPTRQSKSNYKHRVKAKEETHVNQHRNFLIPFLSHCPLDSLPAPSGRDRLVHAKRETGQ